MNTLKKKKFLLISFLTAVLFICSAFFAFNVKRTNAEAITPTAERFLPETTLENSFGSITTASDVYSDNFITAIISENTTKLVIYKDNKFSEVIGTAFQIVKKYDDNTLFATDDGNINKIELNNNFAKTQLHDRDGNSIGCNYFDLNEKYLVKAFSGVGIVYENNVDGYTTNTKNNFYADGNKPIAINSNDEIFYVNSDGIYKRNALDEVKTGKLLVPNVTPSRMVADQTFVYYINGTKIYKLNHTIELPSPQELTINQLDVNYDLGKESTPTGISFKGTNLMISTSDTVQEYKLDDTQLTFTGFAIANGKTAYNRIKNDAVDIERYGNNIAVLDSFKITIFNQKNTVNTYARENYNNILLSEFGGYIPTKLAISNDKLLLANEHHALKLIDLNKAKTEQGYILDVVSPANSIINDVSYQSGYFYVISYNGTNTDVYKLAENGETALSLIKTVSNFDATSMETDVYGNVYLSSGTNLIKLEKTTGYSVSEIATGLTSVKKIQTDLSDSVFILDENKLKHCTKNSVMDIAITAPSNLIKSFAMDYASDKVYFIYENEEFITVSDNLPNIALSDLKTNDQFKITDTSANQDLQIVKAVDGANVYSVSPNQSSFDFNGLVPTGDEYLLICEIEEVRTYASVKMLALAGEDGIVLIDKTQAILTPVTQSDAINEKAFVTTDVSGYYFPIITESGEYALSKSDAKVRIEKATEIKPLKVLTFLDNEFYYAEFTHGETKTHGYIPKAFTVEILSEDFTWNNYSIEKVKKTDFYSDEKLSVIQSIRPTLENGETVRVKSIKDDVYNVIVSDGNGGFIEGYIKKDAIKSDPNTAIRNILIILAVAACVCGTTAYFVIRRKQI